MRTPTLPKATRLTLCAVLIASLGACAVPVARTVRVQQAPRVYESAPVYTEYGTVDHIDMVETGAQPTGGGAALGGVLGGVVGNQFGRGSGRAAATVLGVFGGAVVGNQIEQNQAAASAQRYYRVVVRFDNGTSRSFNYRDLAGLHAGERVRFNGGALERA